MLSISRLMKLILCATVLLLFFLARRMLLFSLKIRLISLPPFSLNCSNATGLDGGELQRNSKKTRTWGGQFVLPCSVTQLRGVAIAEVWGWYFNEPFEDLAVPAAPWYHLCASPHTHFPPVLLPEERLIYIETAFLRRCLRSEASLESGPLMV